VGGDTRRIGGAIRAPVQPGRSDCADESGSTASLARNHHARPPEVTIATPRLSRGHTAGNPTRCSHASPQIYAPVESLPRRSQGLIISAWHATTSSHRVRSRQKSVCSSGQRESHTCSCVRRPMAHGCDHSTPPSPPASSKLKAPVPAGMAEAAPRRQHRPGATPSSPVRFLRRLATLRRLVSGFDDDQIDLMAQHIQPSNLSRHHILRARSVRRLAPTALRRYSYIA